MSLKLSRYSAFVNSSAATCLGVHGLGVFLLAAPWYNFLGERYSKILKFHFHFCFQTRFLVLGLMLDRLYAIKRPLEYQEVLQKDHLIRSLTKLPGIGLI